MFRGSGSKAAELLGREDQRAPNFLSAASMRVRQPAPVALNRGATSRSSRSLTETLRSGFGGRPTRLTAPATGSD